MCTRSHAHVPTNAVFVAMLLRVQVATPGTSTGYMNVVDGDDGSYMPISTPGQNKPNQGGGTKGLYDLDFNDATKSSVRSSLGRHLPLRHCLANT